MKRKSFLLVCFLILCLMMTGCGNSSGDAADDQNEPSIQEPTVEEENEAVNESTAELAAPTLDWWELYNPNGFDTVTAQITNPNSVAVDVSYDLVYYKDGAEAARSEYFANFSILPGGKDIIWANYDIPKSTDVDDVKMENVIVTESAYPPINGKYEYVGIEDNEACYEFEFESQPTLATINFLLYNDNNGNEQFDKGEIVVVSSDSLMEQKGKVSFETDVFPYTNADVYFTAS